MGLEYVGKLAQAKGFEEWATKQGKALVEKLGKSQVEDWFNKQAKAQKAIWDELEVAARSQTLSSAIQREAKEYPALLGEIASAMEPNSLLAGWRVVVVPRFLTNAKALAEVSARLGSSSELTRLQGGDLLRAFFFQRLVSDLDEAFVSLVLNAPAAVPASRGWSVLKYDSTYDWKSTEWAGHFYMAHIQGRTVTDSRKAQMARQIDELSTRLGRLTAGEVAELVSSWQAWQGGRLKPPASFSTPVLDAGSMGSL